MRAGSPISRDTHIFVSNNISLHFDALPFLLDPARVVLEGFVVAHSVWMIRQPRVACEPGLGAMEILTVSYRGGWNGSCPKLRRREKLPAGDVVQKPVEKKRLIPMKAQLSGRPCESRQCSGLSNTRHVPRTTRSWLVLRGVFFQGKIRKTEGYGSEILFQDYFLGQP